MKYFKDRIHSALYGSALPYLHQLMNQLDKDYISFHAYMSWFAPHPDLMVFRQRWNMNHLSFRLKADGTIWTDNVLWCHFTEFEKYKVTDSYLLPLFKDILKEVEKLDTEKNDIMVMLEYTQEFKFESRRKVLLEISEPGSVGCIESEYHISKYVPPPPPEPGLGGIYGYVQGVGLAVGSNNIQINLPNPLLQALNR